MPRDPRLDLRAQLPRWLVRRSVEAPRRVLLAWAAVCVLALPGLLRLSIEASAESTLDKAAAAWSVYQRSLDVFGGDEIIVVALEAASPYEGGVLETVAQLSERFEGLEGVRRVDSITTQPVIRVDAEGDLHLTPATRNTAAEDDPALEVIRARAEADRILPDTLVSRDGRVLAINLVLERDPVPFYETLFEAVAREVVARRDAYRAAWVSGVPVFQWETSLQTRRELLTLGPLTVLAIGVLLSLVFRSARAPLGVLGTGVVGIVSMLACIGMVGVPVSFTMVSLPPILLALAAAYGMHALTAAARAAARAPGSREALADQLEEVAAPIALSGATTTIGFAATSLAGVETVRNLGAFGGFGVLVVLFLTLTALPAFLALAPLPAAEPRGFAWLRGFAAPHLSRLAGRRGGLLLCVWLLFTGAAAFGVSRVSVDTDATRWFRHGTPTRDGYEAIRARLSGISPVNVMVESGDGSVLEPELLDRIDRLDAHLESLPEVGKAVSIADPLRQLHAGFGASGDALPRDAALAEQYLLLLESVEQIEDLVTDDRSVANVLLRLDNNGSAQILAVAREAQDWWSRHAPPDSRVASTGIMYEFARAQDAIAWGQIVGLGAALVAISLVLLVTFRTPVAGAITIAPNVIPLVGIYGAMGILGVPLDAGTVLVGGLAIGIAVDDTIHLASGFFERVGCHAPPEALAGAIQHVLPAVSFTTAIVGLGFLLLALSDFTFVRNLGILMSSVIVLCLLADLFLVPTLLLRGWKSRART